ncbi:MAG: exodeoxyribonuclease VII small subunit [Deltaproteobacteria bacterium]|nr:exodeoxyribonuclease VII small subunit [Deltaproteobacteria bacterium]
MKKPSFETAMAELEKIVREMETGELSLDASLKKFEDGMRLSRLCAEKLDEVQKKVTILMSGDNGSREEAFEPGSDE